MKRTAKKRIEQAVERNWYKNVMIYPHEIVSMIMAERARLKGMVKRLLPDRGECAAYQNGYREAKANVLNLWNERQGGEAVSRQSGMEHLAQICEAFAAGESVEGIAARTGLERATVENVIRQAMKLADRKVTR